MQTVFDKEAVLVDESPGVLRMSDLLSACLTDTKAIEKGMDLHERSI